MSFGIALLVFLMVATVAVLLTGITIMARGGEANRKYGNKLMVARVLCQGAALGVLAVLMLMGHKHQ